MKRKIFFIILLFMIMPMFVNAASVSVSLSCPVTANENSEIECKVDVSSDVAITGLTSHYILNGLTYVNFEAQNGFQSQYSSDNGFLVTNLSGKNGTFTIGIIKLKATGSGSIQLNDLDANDIDGNSYGDGTTSNAIEIRLNSTNNSLKSLTISNGTLSPKFSTDVTSYSATIDVPTVTISATKGDNYQKIIGTGTHNLNYGENSFNVAVTSESGSTKVYTIKITRPDKRSTNNYLKTLSLNNNNISLDKSAINYSMDVESNVSSVKVNASLEDGKSSFVDGYAPRDVNLNYGNNTILIKVKAENESIRTYTVNVNRKDNRSTNNYLKSLSLSDGKIIFNKDTLEYNISVNYDVTKIDVNALVEDEKAVVKVSNPELVVGDNTITIEVVSEAGQVKNYKINVKRLSEEEQMSDNNKISKLSIANHELKFSNDIFEYNIKIGKDENILLFDVKLEDEKASYVIKNNKDLKDGHIVSLIVVSESGIEQEYKFIIDKEKFGPYFWMIIIGIILIILGLIIGIICSKKFKKNNKSSKKENIELKLDSTLEEQNNVFEQRVEENIVKQYPEMSSIASEPLPEVQNNVFEQRVEENIANQYPEMSSIASEPLPEVQNNVFEQPLYDNTINQKEINNVSNQTQGSTIENIVSSNFTIDPNNVNNDL